MSKANLRAVVAVAALSLIAVGCGQAEMAASTSAPALEPTAITVPEMPPQSAELPVPDGSGPVAAIVWGTFGQFSIAPLLAVDESGHTLAYGGGLSGVRDLSVCPGSEKMVVLAHDAAGTKAVSTWDLASFEIENSWPVDDLVGSVRCVSRDGLRSVLYRSPLGMDPSPPTSAGPTTTVLPLGGDEVTGSNSWAILQMDHGTVTTLYDPGEYGKILAFTAHWAVASHNTTLWIVDLSERPPVTTVLDTTFPARAAIDPVQSSVVIAGQYPNSGGPVRLGLYALEPTPLLADETTVAGSAWATPLEWLDEARFIEGFTVYDRDLAQVDSWPVGTEPISDLVVAGPVAFATKMGEHWQDTLLHVDTASGGTTALRTFTGWIDRIAIVKDGPRVTEDAHSRVPDRADIVRPSGPPAPPIMTQLPYIDNLDHIVLEDLRSLVVDSDGEGDRIRAEADQFGPLTDVSQDTIDGCSGVGFAAGAMSSQALVMSEVDGTTVIVYAFTTATDVTVAEIDTASCDILDVVGPLLTPGPGTNITTIPSP
jgi:hypothetical protein